MFLVVSQASKLKPEIRLAQAISEFQKDLSAEQKAAFCKTRDNSTKTPPDHHDIIRLTEEIDRKASRLHKGRRCFGTRFTNVLHTIQQFAALGDVMVGGSQNIIACGVWSLVRMTLLTVVNFSSYLEKLSALLMNVGRSAPRHEMWHQLYPRSKALQAHLSEYFIVVVRLCHHLLKMTKKSTFGQVVTFLGDIDLKNYESELEGISTHIQDEVTLLMGQDVRQQNSRIKILLRSAEPDSERQRQDTRVRVLEACSTYNYETTWKETRKLGNTAWFQQATEYQQWKASSNSATLVCTGKLGSGKSVMLANLVGDLNLEVRTGNCPVTYFFARHDISDSLMADTIVRSLGRQLLRSIPDLTFADRCFKTDGPVLDVDIILEVLLSLRQTFEAYFVLDGLDECDDQQRRLLVQKLRQLQHAFKLRICCACRSDAGNLPTLLLESLANPNLLALPEENPEIEQFIRTELYNCIKSKRLVLGDAQLSLQIADTLSAGAQGMFLWVALQIEALCEEPTDEAIRRALIELPSTLEETYTRILDRSRKRKTGRSYQRRTFELVIAAQRPLTTDEVREALSVTPGDDAWNPARQLNDISLALASCGSLIMVDEENLTVRLIHHSVKQFLIGGGPSLPGAVTSLDDASKEMRATVLTYLNYNVFETQVTTTMVPSIPVQEAPHKIISSISTTIANRDIALKLLKSRSRHLSVDIGKVVSETITQTNSNTHQAMKFYSYAKTFWLKHAWLILEDETASYTMLLKVIGRVLDFSSATDSIRAQLFRWATQYGHPRVLKLCVNKGMDIESQDTETKYTPLFYAAVYGRGNAIKALVELGANLESKDMVGRTPLCLAAKLGGDDAVRMLIDCGADLETIDRRGWTPLSWAAYAGHEAVVKTLLARRANMEAPEESEHTPLILAVRQRHASIVSILLRHSADARGLRATAMTEAFRDRGGDLAMVKVLLQHGADPNLRMAMIRGIRTGLEEAASCADEDMTRLLLDYDADPNCKNDYGGTALMAAVQAEWSPKTNAVICLLLLRGAHVNAKDTKGKTALWYAASYRTAEHVKVLIAHGADRNVRANDESTVFSKAIRESDIKRIEMLIHNGFDVDVKSRGGKTPLSQAASSGEEKVVRMLLKYGADLESRDDDGKTPLAWAAILGFWETARILLENGAKLETKDENGRTPLALVVLNGEEEMARILMEYGADMESKDNQGNTPLGIARAFNLRGLIKNTGTEPEGCYLLKQ